MAVLVVNIVLTVTDLVGWLDVLTGLLDPVLLALLAAIRGRYWGAD